MNAEIPKKIRWNAVASYGLVFASLAFLISKDPKFNHPFVKSHTKVAFIFHCLLLLMLYIMSFPFLGGIKIYTLSLNDIITAVLWLIIFWGIVYGASRAQKWETITIWDLLSIATKKKSLTKTASYNTKSEYDITLLILGHIPFIGYIFSAQERNNMELRDISLLNLLITILCLMLVFLNYKNIAAILFLLYIIWSFFVSIRLAITKELTHLDISFIPTPSEWYILLKAIWVYIKNMFDKNTFVELNTLKEKYHDKYLKKEEKLITELQKKEVFQYSPFLISIPLLNIIWVFYRHSVEQIRISNGILLSLLLLWVILLYGTQSPLFLLALVPFCYHAWYKDRKAYSMPIITDISRLIWYIFSVVWIIWKRTRELQKKEVKGSFASKKEETQITGD